MRALRLTLAVVLAIGCTAATSDREVTVLRDARFRLGDLPGPARDEAAGLQVSLPDAWRERRPEAGGFGWYELAFDGPTAGGETWAVLLPSVNMNAEVHVNGVRIGSGGSFEEPVAHNFNRPLFFRVPAPLLTQGRNVLGVRLFAYPHAHGGLGPVSVGPEAALRPIYDRLTTLRLSLARLATAVAWLTALFILALWAGTRRDPVYGWFGLAILLWSVTSLNYWVRDVPVPHWTWERIIHPPIECFAVALAIWAHRLLGFDRPNVERALLAFALLAVAATALAPIEVFYDVTNALHAGSLVVGGYATLTILGHQRRFSPWERALYLTGGALGLVFAVHDFGVQMGWVEATGVHLLAYLVPVIVLGFGASLIVRFVSSLDAAARLNRELEQRVAQKSAELARNHERLRALERERMIAAERERIMREMHDGMGGHLVSALTLVESGGGTPEATARALRTALADMRVVIDSLDPGLADLPALLGALRARIDPLLDASGLRLDWRVGALPGTVRLGPERSLHLLRVLQEAIANVVRHARATTLRVEGAPSPGGIRLEVWDDGVRFDPEAARAGRGLANMRRRADEIGAALEVASTAEGSRVTITLPWSEA